MKRNSKQLLHLFFREVNGAVNVIEEELDDEDNTYSEIIECMMFRLRELLDWSNEEFNLAAESVSWLDYECSKDFDKYFGMSCEGCGTEEFKLFMVKDELWEEFGCGERIYCMECFENKLGRKLQREDFTDCILNEEMGFINKKANKILN